MSQQPHVAAFIALLGDLNEYVTTTPNLTPPPYVVVHPAMPWDQSDSQTLCGKRSRADNEIQTTCVGSDTEQAQDYAQKVRDRVKEIRPVIAGQQTGLIRNEYSQPARRDGDVSPAVFYAVDGWSFTSTPA